MPAGVVKWFNRQKGFGFISPDGAGEDTQDVFVHFKAIVADGYRNLTRGQRVKFEAITGPKGKFATKVII